MFSNHFTTNFSQNARVKLFLKIGQLANIRTKLWGLLFWVTLYMSIPIHPKIRHKCSATTLQHTTEIE